MRNKRNWITPVLLFLLAFAAFADVPLRMNYQGKLTDAAGVPEESPVSMTFSLWDASSGGNKVWEQTIGSVDPTHGLFAVELDFSAGWEPGHNINDFDAGDLYLQIVVGATTLSPRERITSVAHAFNISDTAVTTDKIRDAAVTPAKLADGGGVDQLLQWNSALSQWELVASSGLGGNNLDEAYNTSPSGNKRIDADDGAVIIESGMTNGGLSVTCNAPGQSAIYIHHTIGGNAIWADENIYANNANIQAKGDINVIDASDNNSAGLVGATGNFWLNGRIDMKNDKTIYAENSSGTPMAILTPLNGANNVILSMADGNNFYIQDNTYSNVAQFCGGSNALFLFGDEVMQDNSLWDADYVECNIIQDGEDDEVHINDNVSTTGYVNFGGLAAAPGTNDGRVYYNSTDGNLYLYDGVATAWVDLTSAGAGGDNDWTVDRTGDNNKVYTFELADSVGIGTATPTEKLDVDGHINSSETYKLDGNTVVSIEGTENILLGVGAGINDPALYNTFVGYRAGYNNSHTASNEGYYNVYIGDKAGYGATGGSDNTGYYNVAVGYEALYDNTTGYGNNAYGYRALTNNTTGWGNTAVGYWALYNNTTGAYNIALGQAALQNNISGLFNVAIGVNTLQQNTVSRNTAVGHAALNFNTTGKENSAFGNGALNQNITGDENTAMGKFALYYTENGDFNTALGAYAGHGLDALGESIFNNCVFGYYAGCSLGTGGDNNIIIGYRAGNNITSGSNNLIIGYDIKAPVATGSNQMSIGNLIFGTGIDGTGTTISSGNIGIGTATPGNKLEIDDGGVGSGLRFTNLTSASTPGPAGTSVLTVDANGDVILVNDAGAGGDNDWALSGGQLTPFTAGDSVYVEVDEPKDKWCISAFADQDDNSGHVNYGVIGGSSGKQQGASYYGFCVGVAGWADYSNFAHGHGVLGVLTASETPDYTAWGYALDAGVVGDGAGLGDGVYGITNDATLFGVNAVNADASGTALIATGNGIAGTYLVGGSGVAGSSSNVGVFGYGDDTDFSWGVYGRTASIATSADGASYITPGAVGVYGRGANHDYASGTDAYHYGVYGEFPDIDQDAQLSAGVIGVYNSNNWGALAYTDAIGNLHGGWFTGTYQGAFARATDANGIAVEAVKGAGGPYTLTGGAALLAVADNRAIHAEGDDEGIYSIVTTDAGVGIIGIDNNSSGFYYVPAAGAGIAANGEDIALYAYGVSGGATSVTGVYSVIEDNAGQQDVAIRGIAPATGWNEDYSGYFQDGPFKIPDNNADPTGAWAEGAMFWDDNDNLLRVYDGSGWVTVGGGAANNLQEAYNGGDSILINSTQGAMEIYVPSDAAFSGINGIEVLDSASSSYGIKATTQYSTGMSGDIGGIYGEYRTSSTVTWGALGHKNGTTLYRYGLYANDRNQAIGFVASGSENAGICGIFQSNSTGGSGGVFKNTSTSAGSWQYGVQATASGANAAATKFAVSGIVSGTAATNYGIYGESQDAVTNYGVYGTATIATGATTNYGVYGAADNATDNYGVYGEVPSGAGNYAVYGEMSGDNNIGYLASGTYGVYGQVGAAAEIAVYGINTSTATTSVVRGVQGVVDDGGGSAQGILGYSSTSDEKIGVYGVGDDWGGYFGPSLRLAPQASGAPTGALGGLYCDNTDNKLYYHDGTAWQEVRTGTGGGNTLDGAYDEGGAGAGRTITADAGAVEINGNNDGAAALDVDNTVAATSTIYGVKATVRNTDGGLPIYAGHFEVTGNIDGASDRYGVYGTANGTLAGDNNYGVFGYAGFGSNNYGVYGEAYNDGVNNYGVYATVSGNANNYALYAEVTPSGMNVDYAGYFVGGPVKIPDFDSNLGLSTAEGAMFWENDADKLWVYNGSAWQEIGAGAGGDNDWAYSSGSGLTGNIYHTGFVGVGNNNPAYLLDVRASGAAVNIQSTDANRASIYLYTQGDAANDLYFGMDGNRSRYSLSGRGSGDGYDLILYRNNAGWDNIMTWDWTDGYVGIQTGAPSEELHVAGDALVTANTYFGDTDAYINQNGSNSMMFRDPNTNGGTAVSLNDLYAGDNLGNHIATQNLVPDATGTHDIGTSALKWDELFVGTVHADQIDPIVQIEGEQYVTWMAEAVGLWIDAIGTAELENGVYAVDLAGQPEGSDLWLFYNTVAENSIVPFVTPQDEAYLMARMEGSVLFVKALSGDKSARFGFRLSGKRRDWAAKTTEEVNIPTEYVTRPINMDNYDKDGNRR
ncbi:hypothetical protein DRQ36_07750 [bacterium]|nr:MAG: hypothetical protein DRQ36_07750 [bacterium]